MRRSIPCGRCGVALAVGTLYCTHCGHQPWAHHTACECGTCCPLLHIFNGTEGGEPAGRVPPHDAGVFTTSAMGGAP